MSNIYGVLLGDTNDIVQFSAGEQSKNTKQFCVSPFTGYLNSSSLKKQNNLYLDFWLSKDKSKSVITVQAKDFPKGVDKGNHESYKNHLPSINLSVFMSVAELFGYTFKYKNICFTGDVKEYDSKLFVDDVTDIKIKLKAFCEYIEKNKKQKETSCFVYCSTEKLDKKTIMKSGIDCIPIPPGISCEELLAMLSSKYVFPYCASDEKDDIKSRLHYRDFKTQAIKKINELLPDFDSEDEDLNADKKRNSEFSVDIFYSGQNHCDALPYSELFNLLSDLIENDVKFSLTSHIPRSKKAYDAITDFPNKIGNPRWRENFNDEGQKNKINDKLEEKLRQFNEVYYSNLLQESLIHIQDKKLQTEERKRKNKRYFLDLNECDVEQLPKTSAIKIKADNTKTNETEFLSIFTGETSLCIENNECSDIDTQYETEKDEIYVKKVFFNLQNHKSSKQQPYLYDFDENLFDLEKLTTEIKKAKSESEKEKIIESFGGKKTDYKMSLFILSGFPGQGKSTITNYFASLYEKRMISSDNLINYAIFNDKDDPKNSRRSRKNFHSIGGLANDIEMFIRRLAVSAAINQAFVWYDFLDLGGKEVLVPEIKEELFKYGYKVISFFLDDEDREIFLDKYVQLYYKKNELLDIYDRGNVVKWMIEAVNETDIDGKIKSMIKVDNHDIWTEEFIKKIYEDDAANKDRPFWNEFIKKVYAESIDSPLWIRFKEKLKNNMVAPRFNLYKETADDIVLRDINDTKQDLFLKVNKKLIEIARKELNEN